MMSGSTTRGAGLATGLAMGLALAAVLTASGCVKLSKAYPQKAYHVIEVERPSADTAPTDAPAIAVRPFHVSPGFEERGLVYRRADGSFETDFYNELFLPLETMVTDATSRWLVRSGRFSSVLPFGSLAMSPLVLEGSVRSAYGDYRDAGNPSAALDVQFLLVRDEDLGPSVVGQIDYGIVRAPLEGTSAADLVRGYEVALAEVLTRLEADLARLLSSEP